MYLLIACLYVLHLMSSLTAAYKHHLYFRKCLPTQCYATRLYGTKESTPIYPRNTSNIVTFTEDSYFQPLINNSLLFNSTTLRYLFSLQSEINSFIAKVEDKFISLRMVLSAKVERDIRATKAAGDFVLRSVTRGGLEVEDIVRPLKGMTDSIQSLPLFLPLLPPSVTSPPSSLSPIIAGLDATTTKQRSKRPKKANKVLGVDSVYQSVRTLPSQVQYDFDRFRRKKRSGSEPATLSNPLKSLPSMARQDGNAAVGRDTTVIYSLLEGSDRTGRIASSDQASATIPTLVPVSSVLTPEVLEALAELFSLCAFKGRDYANLLSVGREDSKCLAEAAQYCADYVAASEASASNIIEHNLDDVIVVRNAVQIILARLQGQTGVRNLEMMTQLADLASYLASSIDDCRLNCQFGRTISDDKAATVFSSAEYAEVGSVYDVDEGRYLSASLPPGSPTALLSSYNQQNPAFQASSAVVIDTDAIPVVSASAQATSKALMALDVLLFLSEKILQALPPLLQRTGEVVEKLFETYGLNRKSEYTEGQWLLFVQFKELSRRSRRS